MEATQIMGRLPLFVNEHTLVGSKLYFMAGLTVQTLKLHTHVLKGTLAADCNGCASFQLFSTQASIFAASTDSTGSSIQPRTRRGHGLRKPGRQSAGSRAVGFLFGHLNGCYIATPALRGF